MWWGVEGNLERDSVLDAYARERVKLGGMTGAAGGRADKHGFGPW